jgi:RimJ/RimL family protein N-acetyltransferase
MIGADNARGRGYAKEATKLLLTFGFDIFQLREIYLEVIDDNLAAQKVYKSCGFIEINRENHLVSMSIKSRGIAKFDC